MWQGEICPTKYKGILSCYKDKMIQLWKYHSTEQALETRSIEQNKLSWNKVKYMHILYLYCIYMLCIIIAIYHECTWNTSVKLVQMMDSWVIAAIYYGKQLMYPCTCYKTIDSSLCNLGTIPIEIDLPLNFSPYFSLKNSRTFPDFSLLLSYNL